MDDKEFNALASATRLSQASREAARLVFVEGRSQVEAAAVMQLSKQRMTQIVGVIRKTQAEQQQQPVPAHSEAVEAIDASYAFAVKAARDQYGDNVRIDAPGDGKRSIGNVISRTDFHLVQFTGKDTVVIHELAKLARVPALGQNVAIEYANGRGEIIDRSQERSRGGLSR